MWLARRLVDGLMLWPRALSWLEVLGVASVASVLIAVVAGVAQILEWQPRPERLSLMVFLVPALTEELAFRGFLPSRGDSRNPGLWIAGGVAAFVAWHVVEALTFLPGARLFLEPGFLVCTAILGLACAIMRYRTGSVWPGVLFHGLIVLAWQGLFGGPGFSALMRH